MFIFSSTFNLLHHFKMRQAFVFTLVIVLISQFNRDQATELLIESAESRLLDLRVAGSTDVHNSSDGPHEICKQLHQDGFQLSMNANGPSIKSLCDGFKNKQEGKCIVGRCECPEERQFCTNNADSKKKFQKPIIYNDPTEQFGKTMKVPTKKSSAYERLIKIILEIELDFDDKTELAILTQCYVFSVTFTYGAMFVLVFGKPRTRKSFEKYIIPCYTSISGLSIVWFMGFRMTAIILFSVEIYILLYAIAYHFLFMRGIVFIAYLEELLRVRRND
ncbi:uncharacterized protein LOC109532875 isoform X4 [Dendroctonus ponderosae]|uniref:uncharacterized protein LOC109532875 isoform X4 n=1 Tax=Dendroctonus ponderosae TaxID=77166 RepID=UPI0020350CF8|nr:uncharacterized protein LOC109532875 isoform X4 [Dendroctonus ponderosae]